MRVRWAVENTIAGSPKGQQRDAAEGDTGSDGHDPPGRSRSDHRGKEAEPQASAEAERSQLVSEEAREAAAGPMAAERGADKQVTDGDERAGGEDRESEEEQARAQRLARAGRNEDEHGDDTACSHVRRGEDSGQAGGELRPSGDLQGLQ